MTLDGYNRFCRSLPHTAHVIQWDDAHVWKVGGPRGKVFAIASRWEGPSLDITFKASQLSFDLLKPDFNSGVRTNAEHLLASH